ncbi:hypothetical protein D3C83_76340 [compost metagenome]
MEILGSYASQVACAGLSQAFQARSAHSPAGRPAHQLARKMSVAPRQVCRYGWTGSPVKTKNPIGSRSISACENANTVKLKCRGASALTAAPGPK